MRILKGSFASILSLGALRILGVLLAFIQSIVVARVFGAEVFGVYSFAIAVISVLGLVFSFGLDEFLMREIAARGLDRSRTDASVQGALKFAILVIAPTICVVTVSGFVFFVLSGLGGEYQWALAGVTISYLFLITRKFSEALAVALKRQALSFLGSKIIFPLSMITFCCAVWLFAKDPDLHWVVIAYVISLTLSSLVSTCVIWTRAKYLFGVKSQSHEINARSILTPSILLALVMSANLIVNNMDTVLIGLIASPEQAAFSRVGQKLSDAVGLILMVAMIHYRPLLAEAHWAKDRHLLEHHVLSLSKILAFFGILSFCAIQYFSYDIVRLFGEDYFGGVPALRAYTVGSLAIMLSGPGTLLLMMTGEEKAASRILWLILLCNFSLDIALIPLLGALGAGIATAISQVVLAVLTARACLKLVGINPSYFSQLKR